MFFAINPKFKILLDLKEKYIQFNNQHYPSVDKVTNELDILIKLYASCGISMFEEFSIFLNKHRNFIIQSFNETIVTRTQRNKQIDFLSRISNGPMEGFNRLPKDLKRTSRGMKNFDYNRNRILWATRINPPIRSIPKTNEQIHSYKLNKRTAKKRPNQYDTK